MALAIAFICSKMLATFGRMEADGANLVWFLILGVVIPAGFAVLAFRSPGRQQLRRWAENSGVALTDTNRDLVRSHLGRVRRFRSLASLPFWWMAFAWLVMDLPEVLMSPLPGLAAYLLGSLVAEMTTPKLTSGEVRNASLLVRRVDDFRPRWVRAAPWALFGLTIVQLLILPWQAERAGDARRILHVLLVSVAMTLLAELAALRIVRRPQPGADPDVLAADDGLRATAVSLVAGSALLTGVAASHTAAAALLFRPAGWWVVPAASWLWMHVGLGVGVLVLVARQETWGRPPRHHQPNKAVTP